MRRWLLAVTPLLLLLSATGARADFVSVRFSYAFADGTTLAGTATGDRQGNSDLVTGLTNLSAVYSGSPATPFTFQSGFATRTLSLSGLTQFDLSGYASDPNTSSTNTNFGFDLNNRPTITNAVTVGTFMTSASTISYPQNSDAREATPFVLASYSASVVPEPSSLTLCGIAVVAGLGIARNRRRCA